MRLLPKPTFATIPAESEPADVRSFPFDQIPVNDDTRPDEATVEKVRRHLPWNPKSKPEPTR